MNAKVRSTSTCLSVVGALVVLLPATARAETTLQLWANATAEWQVSHPTLVIFDLEPKVLLVGQGEWWNVDFTPSAEYGAFRWLDLIGENLVGYTYDTQNPNGTEVTPRLGFRVYPIRERFQLRDTWRIEYRNRFYSDGTSDHAVRTRNRVELRWVANREKSTDPGAVILLADWEVFVPFGQEVRERYASRHRFRAGVGYRLDAAWRFDLLYIYQISRDTQGNFDNRDNIIDLRVRLSF